MNNPTTNYLEPAVACRPRRQDPRHPTTKAFGCSVKYDRSNFELSWTQSECQRTIYRFAKRPGASHKSSAAASVPVFSAGGKAMCVLDSYTILGTLTLFAEAADSSFLAATSLRRPLKPKSSSRPRQDQTVP